MTMHDLSRIEDQLLAMNAILEWQGDMPTRAGLALRLFVAGFPVAVTRESFPWLAARAFDAADAFLAEAEQRDGGEAR
jgi:hypothetical protein